MRTALGQLDPLGIVYKVWQCLTASGKCQRQHHNFWYDNLLCCQIDKRTTLTVRLCDNWMRSLVIKLMHNYTTALNTSLWKDAVGEQ
ncbi:hypothetical protein [Calothrix sp. NIES-2098]|uniref:hypothetical protein n=1 Tax=Calothrix sp. NIES-2098 TaxID=1954171 RepID=UPI0030DDDC77